MKKTFSALLIATSLLISSISAPARASIVLTWGTTTQGVVMASLIAVAGAGGLGAVVVQARRGNCGGTVGSLGCGLGGVIALGVLAFGLLVLDGEQGPEVQFQAINGTDSPEIAVYNQELDELNAINQTISAELVANPKLDVNARWLELGSILTPSTLKIAALSSQQLLESM